MSKMDIFLVAISNEDGWAYIKVNDQFFLIYPPFDSPFLNEVKQEEIERATKFGFKQTNIKFHNKKELLYYLEKEYISTVDTLSLNISNEELLKGFMETLTSEDVKYYLTVLADKLIPTSQYEIAFKLLNKIQDIGILKNDEGLHLLYAKVLAKLSEPLFSNFPSLSKKSGDYRVMECIINYSAKESNRLVPCE